MTENGTTEVRFDLWAVLAFLVATFVLCFGYLFTAVGDSRTARIATDQALEIRVTRLEANTNHIMTGIADLQRGQEKIAITLDAHERNARNAVTMKKWQDVPASR